MQNNGLFEGREKRETGDQVRLGEYSRGWFGEVAWDCGLEMGWVVGWLTWTQNQAKYKTSTRNQGQTSEKMRATLAGVLSGSSAGLKTKRLPV